MYLNIRRALVTVGWAQTGGGRLTHGLPPTRFNHCIAVKYWSTSIYAGLWRLKPGFHSNAIVCVSCGFRLRNARNASDCVWMETGLRIGGRLTCVWNGLDWSRWGGLSGGSTSSGNSRVGFNVPPLFRWGQVEDRGKTEWWLMYMRRKQAGLQFVQSMTACRPLW